MDRRTILAVAKRVEELGLIKRKAIPGKYTIYTLLEPKMPTSSKNPPVRSTGGKLHPTGGKLPGLVENSKRTNEEERMKNTNTRDLESLMKTKTIRDDREEIYNNSKAVEFEKISFKNSSYKKEKEEKQRTGGATYEWQDVACRLWKSLGLKGNPSSSFFKIVKKAEELGKRGLLYSAYSFVVDANAKDPEKLFYWKFNELLKNE